MKRVAVDPAAQHDGVGDFLLDACRGVGDAVGRSRLRLGVRHELPGNRAWFERRGFRAVVEHDDWTELEVAIEPIAFRARATLWKYEYPDHLQAHFGVDVLDDAPTGTWALLPAFAPHLDGVGNIAHVMPGPVVGYLPRDEWWTAWFGDGRQRLKVDICTPAERRPDGDLEFRDLCLDVVVRDDDAPLIVDEDELEAADYPPEVAARAREAAADVLARVTSAAEPFGTLGWERLRSVTRSGS